MWSMRHPCPGMAVRHLNRQACSTIASRTGSQQCSATRQRYERGSMLVTSNRSVSEWGTVLNDQVVATAILDRLLHHSHVLTIRGDSYRLREKRHSGLLKRSSTDASSERV